MNYKFYLFKYFLKEYGFCYALKKTVLYLLRPIINLMKRSLFLVNFRYGILPNLKKVAFFSQPDLKILKLPQTDLVRKVRKFWYANVRGSFNLEGELISRKEIFTYGGPNPKFTCSVCQKSEWLSRVRQKNLFVSHLCPQAKECLDLCKKQGDELWTHFHQNFDFFIGCNPNLPAPKCLYLTSKDGYHRFLIPRCDCEFLIGKKRFGTVCQVDVTCDPPLNVDWSKYDFLFMHDEVQPKFTRPNIPVILYGHDFYLEDKSYQWVIDWVKPDIFLTPYPTPWKENFKFPSQTKIAFYPLFPSLFFTRPNLDNKQFDLLVIGATASPVYKPRHRLDEQISQLSNCYKMEFSHRVGALRALWEGPTWHTDPITKSPVYYLNKWSEYLGSAKYVTFGRTSKQFLLWKYYETLGSGAVPIFPQVPDLKLLGVKAFEHYIPLSEIEGNNKRLKYFLDNYGKYKYIAENAVNWYRKNEFKLLLDDFEEIIRAITGYKYPKRLLL